MSGPSGRGLTDTAGLVLRELKNGLFILLGILSAGMGLHGFLLSSRFIDGIFNGLNIRLAPFLMIPVMLAAAGLLPVAAQVLGDSTYGRARPMP